MWTSVPHSLCVGALACIDAIPGIASASLALLATHFGGFFPFHFQQPLLLGKQN